MKKNYKFRSLFRKTLSAAFLGTTLMAAVGNEAFAQYCTPSNASSPTYYINSVVTTGGVTNISNSGTTFSTAGYGDYSAMTATTTQGATMTLTSTAGPTSTYTYVWGVWADWNHDFDFDDPGETIYTQSSYYNSITTTFTIPASAASGLTRLRIRNAYFSPIPGACGANSYGEAEDYTLIIGPPNNAGVRALVSPETTPFCSNVNKDLKVSVVNLGSNALNTATINWSLDGITQTPISLPAPLTNYNDSVVITLGNIFFANTTPKQLKAWTSMPNGVADTRPADDTLNTSMVASLQGVDVKITPGDTIICVGNSITLDAGTFPFNPIYIWENGTLTQTRTVSTSGTYRVKVQTNMGCVDYDTVFVTVHPEPLLNSIAVIDNNDLSFTFNAIGAQNINSFTWNFGDGSNEVNDSGMPVQLIHPFPECGEYTVTLTVRNDCGELTSTRQVKIDCATTGIDNVSSLQKEISVFPNPSTSKVTISNKAHIKMKGISVMNLMGQNVYKNDKVNAEQAEINISQFAAGIYNVLIDTEKGIVTKKLEVIR
jgi:hypothetical protein